MAVTYSEMIELGTEAPPFELEPVNPHADGVGEGPRSLDNYRNADALVVVFTCNHCPYAKHVEEALIRVANEYRERGVAFVAISSNDPARYPDDSPESMRKRAMAKNYPFPYLYDETQEVARAYGAACTPDFFLFDGELRLAYRGRFDETRPGQGVATGRDLRRAMDELLEQGAVSGAQHPSIGCNIKWRS